MYSQDRHEDVLDMCLVQFEPDSAEFIKVGRQPGKEEDKKVYWKFAYLMQRASCSASTTPSAAGVTPVLLLV